MRSSIFDFLKTDSLIGPPPSEKAPTPTKSATNLMNFVQAQPGSPFAAAAAKAKKAEEEANFTNSAISSEEPMKMSMSDLSSPKGNQSVSNSQSKRERVQSRIWKALAG